MLKQQVIKLTESEFKTIIKESINKLITEAVLSIDDIYSKYYSSIPRDIFNEIISSDPTFNKNKGNKMGKYGKWLLGLYLGKRLKLEDLYKATNYLRCFIDYYNVIKDKDINKIKSLQQLYDVVRPYLDGNTATSKSDEIRKIKEDAEKVYEDNEWIVIVPYTKEASCYYGKGTQWCTAAEKSHNYFDQYNNQGPLYININKTDGSKYQFHFETDSFMDENDYEIEEPIADTIGLSDGLINWYKENVEDGNKITEERINFFFDEENSVEYCLIKNSEDGTYKLYEKGGDTLCDGLVCNNGIEEMRQWYNSLTKKKYCIIPNDRGKYTLLIYSDNLYFASDSIINASIINNQWYDDSWWEYIYLDLTYSNGRRCIMANNGYNIYSVDNPSLIKDVDFISGDIIEVKKTNGYSDLVNVDYETIMYDYRDIEVDWDEDYTVYAYNVNDEKVKVHTDTEEEELIESNDDID